MQAHEAANLFPPMSDEEMAGLIEDIREHGQREPIVLWQGKILDGRNRWKALHHLGILPETREWDGVGSPIDYVISVNLHRRMLDTSQRAAVAVEALPLYEAEARERQRLAGIQTQAAKKEPDQLPANLREAPSEATPAPEPEPRKQRESTSKAGKAFGVSGRSVSTAKALKEKAPEKFEEVKKGEKTLNAATKEVKQAEAVAADQQSATYMQVIRDSVPGAADRIDRSEQRAKFSRIRRDILTRLVPLDAELIADIEKPEDNELNNAFLRSVRHWLDAFDDARRRGLRAVK